jgi:quinol monooxygenase YgiN
MFFELRRYKIRPGQMNAWIRVFEDEILPFQTEKGMTILGSFQGEDDPETWVWIRRFESEAEKERLYKAVYESDHWKNVIAPKIPDLMDRTGINVTRLTATPRSVIQ